MSDLDYNSVLILSFMNVTIDLESIRLYAYHGCFAEEQKVGNWYEVNISLDVDCQRAAQSDDIADALNYVEVYRLVVDEMTIKSHLLENVAMRICQRLRTRFAAQGLLGGSVRVAKLAPPVGGEMRAISVKMTI